MGTDIHAIAQVKKDGKWTTVSHDVAGCDRDYNSFAILADVRNGSGFAGITTGEGWKPIAGPRGLPSDLELIGDNHVQVAKWYFNFDLLKEDPQTTYWLGYDGFSWLTLDELEDYWEQNMVHGQYMLIGVVEREQYRALQDGIIPTSWSGRIHGPKIKVANQMEFDPADKSITHVQCSWTIPRSEAVHYYPNLMAALKEVRDSHGVSSKDVRVVFGFDS